MILQKYLLHHDLGEEKGFWGVVTVEDLVKEDGQTKFGTLRKETRIDDETAQKLIKLISNEADWKNRTNIPIKVTDSPRFVPPERRPL